MSIGKGGLVTIMMVFFSMQGKIQRIVRDQHKSLTLPKTKSSPLRLVVSNRNLLFQGSMFRGYVSFREGSQILIDRGYVSDCRCISLDRW